MKLEFEPQSASLPMVDPQQLEDFEVDSGTSETGELLRKGIEAAQTGDRADARGFLLRVTDMDPDNESAWLWLSSISEFPEELLVFLNNVLRINPSNERAMEWAVSTRSLLAKNFVQQGADAAEKGDTGVARQFFMQAIVHDDQNQSAWLWLASLASTEEEKKSHLGRVLRLDPENETALKQMEEFKAKEAKARLMDANRLAIAGGREEAEALLEAILTSEPDMEDAWMLRAHLAESFEDKIRCFERVLEINSENTVARANLESLKVFVGSAPEADDDLPAHEEDPDLMEMDTDFGSANGSVSPVTEFHEEDAAVEPEEETFESFEAESTEEAEAVSYETVQLPKVVEFESIEQETDDWSVEDSEDFGAIAQPDSADELESSETRDFVPVESDEFLGSEPVSAAAEKCAFCDSEMEAQAISCGTCHAVHSLSDMELLLSNQDVDAETVEAAVTRLESGDGVDTESLRLLGVAYINLKQFRKGFGYLEEFASKQPGDVVLRSQVDALAVRVSEIEAQETEREALPKSKTILVVDDSPTIRKLISLKLQKCGHETICAVDGVDALEKINEVVPDLVLLDITMPRMDGYQTCKLIRGNEATRDVPVVMISGKDGFFDKVRGKMAGTTNYITKPFGPETLMRTVNEYLM